MHTSCRFLIADENFKCSVQEVISFYLRCIIQAKFLDEKDSIAIIAETFDANPSVNIVIGEKGNHGKKIRRLGDYAFIKALNRDGAYLWEK